jgi:hypothetical protein
LPGETERTVKKFGACRVFGLDGADSRDVFVPAPDETGAAEATAAGPRPTAPAIAATSSAADDIRQKRRTISPM